MPKRCFSLDTTGEYLVELEWRNRRRWWEGQSMTNLQVKLNGKLLYIFIKEKDLEKGRYFALPDGRQFSVRLREGELETRLQGLIVPGSNQNVDFLLYSYIKKLNYQNKIISVSFIWLNFFNIRSSTSGIDFAIFSISGLLMMLLTNFSFELRSKELHFANIFLYFIQNIWFIYLLSGIGSAFLFIVLSAGPIYLLASGSVYAAIEDVRATEAAYAALGSLDEIGQGDEATKAE